MAAWVAAYGKEAVRLHALRTGLAAVRRRWYILGMGDGFDAIAAWRVARRVSGLAARLVTPTLTLTTFLTLTTTLTPTLTLTPNP